MSAYTDLKPEQRMILRELRAGQKRAKAPRKHLEAAIETGLVESGLRNLNHGDADSQGWRQERKSLYKNPTNVRAAVDRFFAEAKQHDREGITSGELAARVQRPRADLRGKYEQRDAQADALMRDLLTRDGGGSTPPRRRGGGSLALPGAELQALPDVRAAKVNATLGLLRGGDSVTDFAMNIRGLDEQVAQVEAQNRLATATPAGIVETEGGKTPTPTRPRAPKVSRNGDYQGTHAAAKEFALLGIGNGLKVTSRKRDNKNPASGDRSDHHHANKDAFAYDLSNGSQPTPEMDETAYEIARRLGKKDYKKGQPLELTTTINGIRYQVLYRTMLGGNHFNHVHVGAKRVS